MITKTCTVSGKEFIIMSDDLDFYRKMDVISQKDCDKLKSREISDCVGLPTLCPTERQRRRLAFRNERNLYQRKCNGTDKKIISMYSADSEYIVYENEYWWSDNWDGQDCGQDVDFSRDFFSQFDKLNKKVPKMARIQQGENVNSTFCNCASWNKNCYLIFSANENEDCMYGKFSFKCRDCIDCLVMDNNELCYECINAGYCYNCMFCFTIEHCSDCLFCKQCVGCKDCFGCVNLINKQYYFLNKKCTKEEYQKKIAELDLNTSSNYKNLRENFAKFIQKFPQKYMEGYKNENVSGDIVYYSKNAHECFDVQYLEDCKFCNDVERLKSAYDVSYYGSKGTNELLYECEGVGHGVFEVKFSKLIWGGSTNIDYSWECFKCRDCFGCSGLKNAQYYIFNKKYSKEEYFKTREKIIAHMKKTGEWGEFFPIEISSFAYNETVADEYFPLTESEILAKNWKYRAEKQSFKYDGPTYEIPAKITDVTDEILDKILTCEVTGKYYKIQRAELKFYQKMNLPIPRLCPDERHKRRMNLRNPRELYDRTCDDCETKIMTTFSPDRTEKVLCENCYLKVIE